MAKKRAARKCQYCRKRFKPPARGPLPKFCSHACRQRAFETRKLKSLEYGYWQALSRDLLEARVQGFVRDEVARTLVRLGVLPSARGRVINFKAVPKTDKTDPKTE